MAIEKRRHSRSTKIVKRIKLLFLIFLFFFSHICHRREIRVIPRLEFADNQQAIGNRSISNDKRGYNENKYVSTEENKVCSVTAVYLEAERQDHVNTRTTIRIKLAGLTILFKNSHFMLHFFCNNVMTFRNWKNNITNFILLFMYWNWK